MPRPKSPEVHRKTQAVYAQIAFILHSIFANLALLLSKSKLVSSDTLKIHSILYILKFGIVNEILYSIPQQDFS